MVRWRWAGMAWAVIVLSFGSGVVQGAQVGDTCTLVERDIHIPTHPAPGDYSIPFRFAGGSSGLVLAIDSGTGWVQLRGEQVGGAEGVGWITPTYIRTCGQQQPTPPPTPIDPAWCPVKGSSSPRASRLRLATWNLGNLHSQDGQSTYTGPNPSEKRFADDYGRIRCYVRLFDPDILAVQEVDGESALQRVVDEDVYNLHVSSRPQPAGMGGKQNTGFAYKKGLTVQEQPDFTDLDVSNGSLRRGTRIDVSFAGQTFKLMSVHLKSGCFDNGSSGSACATLSAQVPVLEQWIDTAAAGAEPFVVFGDFNRRFNLAGDNVWAELDDGQPANADLTAVTENMPITCRGNEFTSFIDHIVFDKRAISFVDRSSFRHMSYRQEDKPVWDKISDHCPVIVEMWAP